MVKCLEVFRGYSQPSEWVFSSLGDDGGREAPSPPPGPGTEESCSAPPPWAPQLTSDLSRGERDRVGGQGWLRVLFIRGVKICLGALFIFKVVAGWFSRLWTARFFPPNMMSFFCHANRFKEDVSVFV